MSNIKVEVTEWFPATKEGVKEGYSEACRVSGAAGCHTCVVCEDGEILIVGYLTCDLKEEAVRFASEDVDDELNGTPIMYDCEWRITEEEFVRFFHVKDLRPLPKVSRRVMVWSMPFI